MYLDQCIDHYLNLDHPNYEIILLPDETLHLSSQIKVIPTGTPSPSVKRNVGINNAKGEICAFIDADAYPASDWLSKAEEYFFNPNVGAIGGPNLTPHEDSMMQKAAGHILASTWGGGTPSRYSPLIKRECRELQSVNMFVRKSILEETGGFDPNLWPGEDAKLSYAIRALGKKLFYIPDLVVYHHRRPLFLPLLKQMWNYGLTKPTALKGHWSFKHMFFCIPSLFVLGILVGPFLFNWLPFTVAIYFIILGIYMAGVLWSSRKPSSLKMKATTFVGTFLTHITYGIAFFVGLFRTR